MVLLKFQNGMCKCKNVLQKTNIFLAANNKNILLIFIDQEI